MVAQLPRLPLPTCSGAACVTPQSNPSPPASIQDLLPAHPVAPVRAVSLCPCKRRHRGRAAPLLQVGMGQAAPCGASLLQYARRAAHGLRSTCPDAVPCILLAACAPPPCPLSRQAWPPQPGACSAAESLLHLPACFPSWISMHPPACLPPSLPSSENDDVGRLRRGLSHTFLFDSFDVDAAVTPAGMLCMVRGRWDKLGRHRLPSQQSRRCLYRFQPLGFVLGRTNNFKETFGT